MLPTRRSSFSPPPTALERQLIPVLSTMAAALVPLVPIVLSQPLLPPFGLMVFLGWRLLRGNIWPLWMGLPLGLWDDLFSGQPLGSAMCGWTIIMLALDAVDRRMAWRSHLEDWGLATLAIAGHLAFALGVVRITGGQTSLMLIAPQIALSTMAYPLVARACAALDRRRNPR